MRLHCHPTTPCHRRCPRLQTKLSSAKITIRKVERALLARGACWRRTHAAFISCSLSVSASRPQPTVAPQDEYLISPITGEKIQASKMQEHMRIGLLDPRWLEQRDRSIRDRQTEDEVFAPGLDIESSLKQLAERRTDIFGVEETAIGKKIGEEEIQKPEEKVSLLAPLFFFCVCSLFPALTRTSSRQVPRIGTNLLWAVSVCRSPGTATRGAWPAPSRPRRPTLPSRSRLKPFTRPRAWWERMTPRRRSVRASPASFPTSPRCPRLQPCYRNPTPRSPLCPGHLPP